MEAQPSYQQGGYPQGGYQQQPPQGQPQGGPPQQQGGYQPAPGAPPPGGPPPPPSGGAAAGEYRHGDDDGAGERSPSPPPLSNMDQVQGYENANFQADAFIPPPAYEATAPAPTQSSPVQANIPTISEEEAREALMREVSQNCCYGRGAAENLVFTNIQPSSAFHYQLETFTEGRKTAWAFAPYSGEPIDGPQNGPAPRPWDVKAQPRAMFEDHVMVFEVPHTASVKPCHSCLGMGMKQCRRCIGSGQITCDSCSGTGRHLRPHIHHDHHHHGHHHHGHGNHHHHHHGSHVDMESVVCHSCNGAGRKRCWSCHGSGSVQCSLCQGKRQLKCYIKLTVSFKMHKADHIVERTALPDHLIRGAGGRVVFQETKPRVFAVAGCLEQEINSASRQLVDSHAISFPTERILRQRHWIRTVPVSEARCDYKAKGFTFWVYGEENNVHAPDYPQQVCWGCSIL